MTLTSRGVRTANCLKQLTRKQIDSIDPRQKMLRFFCCCCFSSENSDDEVCVKMYVNVNENIKRLYSSSDGRLDQ